ncbi:VRR-NUC domain-containing protein [Cytidiella melzeri]|nr:VRR-NUC domain-containing protein [Cytidiella melzeri]
MYVTLFEEMVNVVIQSESYLFDEEEVACFARYQRMSYPARYLFVRLCLRKTDQWLRLGELKYQQELGENIAPAMREICTSAPSATALSLEDDAVKVKTEVRDDIIDLTEEQDFKPDVLTLKKQEMETKPSLLATSHDHDYSMFADDESRASLRDLLECLNNDELREIVKIMHVQKKENKRESLISVLLTSTLGQATLPFSVVSSSKAKNPVKKRLFQTPLTSYMSQTKGKRTQQDSLRAIVTDRLEACIKLNPDIVKLFQRMNVVYFRSTQYSSALLTQAILARCKKRNYAEVPYNRVVNIWESREALLRYEAALEWEAQIDEIWNTGESRTSRARSRSVASKTPGPVIRLRSEHTQSPDKREASIAHGLNEFTATDDKPRTRDAKEVKAVFEKVYPLWRQLVAVEGEEDGRGNGLERFHHGHVLTRIVCKGAEALGILKEYEQEVEVLDELIAQRRWRRARRGRWHERRASILMTHYPKDRQSMELAYKCVIEALQDNDTHIIYRPKLLRRLRTLEKRLSIPEVERVQCSASLQQAEEEFITGIRVHLTVDSTGKLAVPENKHIKFANADSQLWGTQNATASTALKVQVLRTGKSIWIGRDEEEVNVETYALQHYETSGYKGFHCEGRIVTTIFGLLFWDIIFAPIPGAFETMYQVAPLDIAEETFYTSRQELFQARLAEIKEGKAVELLTASYDKHGPEKRVCVGVRWDLFERQDLLEIVEYLDSAGLAAICQVLAEDYGNRTSGVPDLIIWNNELSTCKFVEVKGPGDSLQENQKTWIAVLLQAGIPVEVCHVREDGKEEPKRKKKAPAMQSKRKREPSAVPESEDEEANYSQLDTTQYSMPHVDPLEPFEQSGAVDLAQREGEAAVMTCSPRKKRRLEAQ